jgi:hypothetical protein
MKSITLIAALLSLSACATCERHPAVCATAGAIVIGSVVYTLNMQSDRHASPPGFHPLCAPNCMVQ